MSQLENIEPATSDLTEGSSNSVYKAVNHLLTYMPLIDIVDTKCK